MKRFLCIIVSLVMLLCAFSGTTASAKEMINIIEKDGVLQIGDFDSLCDGYIIYCPKSLADSGIKLPVAVWANGTMCAPALYKNLLVGIAKAGYIVVASPDMMPKDGTMQIGAVDYILAENTDKNSIFYNKIDAEKIGAIGHSQGGAGSVNAAVADSRIRAVVSIAGASTANEAKKLTVPTLFLTGQFDLVVLSSVWVKPSYNACKAPAAYASLNKSVHTSCMSDAEKYVNYSVKWLNAWLNGGDKSAFVKGGELSSDNDWSGFESKNFDNQKSETFFEKLSAFFKHLFEYIFAK